MQFVCTNSNLSYLATHCYAIFAYEITHTAWNCPLFSYIQLGAQGVTRDTTAPNNTEKIGEVTIKQNRLKEKLKESPLTVESMGAQSIRETPASDFYEALGHLKA